MVAYAGLNPSHHRSGTSIDRPTRISKIGNATLRASLYMPALSAMRFNPAVKALVTRLKSAGRLKPKQIVVAAMLKVLVICLCVLKTGRPFDPTHRHAGLNPGIIPIPLFDWELIIPPSRSCPAARPARAARESRRGPQARARLRALSLTAVSPPACLTRSSKADLVLDAQHGIYPDQQIVSREPLAKLSAHMREFPARITTLDRNLVISSDSRHT